MKPIKGYENYLISECGTKVFNKLSNKFISVADRDKNIRISYKAVSLRKDNIYKSLYVHRLVAITYVENSNNLPIVNHIDGDKNNNHFSNLEWCTQSHNLSHAYRIGSKKFTEKQKNGVKKIHEKQSFYKKVINVITGEIFKSIVDAGKSINMSKSLLSRKLGGKLKNNTNMRYYIKQEKQ